MCIATLSAQLNTRFVGIHDAERLGLRVDAGQALEPATASEVVVF